MQDNKRYIKCKKFKHKDPKKKQSKDKNPEDKEPEDNKKEIEPKNQKGLIEKTCKQIQTNTRPPFWRENEWL